MAYPDPEARRRHRESQARYYKANRKKVCAREKRRYHKHAVRERFRKGCDRALGYDPDADLTQAQWEFILSYYDNRCAYTGQPANGVPLELEHVNPLSQGGRHTLGNVVPALPEINKRKFTKDPADWMDDEGIDTVEFFKQLKACTQAWYEYENEQQQAELARWGEHGPPLDLDASEDARATKKAS
jgi:5-methylcytosine-specific restriction endonuclease McrA